MIQKSIEKRGGYLYEYGFDTILDFMQKLNNNTNKSNNHQNTKRNEERTKNGKKIQIK